MNNAREFFKSFKKGMGYFGQSIAVIINTILLTAVYIIGVGITSVIARIFGKRFLETKKKKGSYWSHWGLRKKNINYYYRQF